MLKEKKTCSIAHSGHILICALKKNVHSNKSCMLIYGQEGKQKKKKKEISKKVKTSLN